MDESSQLPVFMITSPEIQQIVSRNMLALVYAGALVHINSIVVDNMKRLIGWPYARA